MAAEDEQGGSATPNSRDDDSSQLTDSTTPAAAPARPIAATNNNDSTVTPATNNSSSSSSTAPTAAGSTASAPDSTPAGGNSSDSFLAAAAAEARQQQSAPASGAATAASTAVGDSALLVDSTQKMSELTASSVAAVSSKLDQVRGYIRQTSTAMEGLEQQADLGKIGQYNTLVKVLRELKASEAKLDTHLATLRSAGAPAATAPTPATAPTSDADGPAVPNSQSIGQVSSSTVNNVDNTGGPRTNTLSMSERLAAGMEEANQITDRLRENVARREDMMERYRATRERLSALKRQRRDIQQQERTLLIANSPRDSPYEDPIPGAANWSLDELNKGLVDFRALYDKVAALRSAYSTKAQTLEESDTVGRSETEAKMQQLQEKRTQIIGVITQLKRLRAEKMREQGMDADVDTDDFDTAPADGSSTSAPSDAAAAGEGAAGGATAAAPRPELQQQLSAAVEAMEETDTLSRGGSVSIGTLPTLVSGADISGINPAPEGGVEGGVTEDPAAAVVVARAEMEAAGRELTLRTQHLNNLKEELAGMKRLLDTTQRRVTEEGEQGQQAAGPSAPPSAPGERTGQYITGVNGNILRLSDLERQDPAVIQKYKQLSEAKQRMAQMEEIMQAISNSRGSGLPLNEVLTPQQLSLLEEAEAEEDPSGSARLRRSRSARRSGDRESDDGSVDRDFFNDSQQPSGISERLPSSQAPPSFSSLPPITNNTAGDRNNSSTLISSSTAARRQNQLATEALSTAMKNKKTNYYAANNEDSDDVASDVQQRLAKPSNAARRPVNEEAGRRKQQERWGREEVNNQQQFLRPNNSQRAEDVTSSARSRSSSCNERAAMAGAGPRGGDPRVAAIVTMQEELRQKKNALEALMRGMGKPSSLHPDNISDNISDGESGTLTPTPIRPARGRRGNRDQSVEFSSGRGGREQAAAAAQHLTQPDIAGGVSRRHHTPSGAVMSFNNLSAGGEGDGGASARSVRPKQNSRSSTSRLPGSDTNRRNMLGDGTNTHQTISEALQQLSTVQGSINSLYDTLRTERDVRSSTPSVANNRQQMALLQQQQQQQELKYQQQQLQQQQVLNNMFALAAPSQPPSLLPGGVPSEAAASVPPAPLVSGIQQCFSQLYLHSLEIQALNKHIQVRNQQQLLQMQHLHQQQQLQQAQQQQQQQLMGAGSLLPSPYYSAPMTPLSLLSASPYTAALGGAGVMPNTGVGGLGLPPTSAANVPGVAPTGLNPYPTFPNMPPF